MTWIIRKNQLKKPRKTNFGKWQQEVIRILELEKKVSFEHLPKLKKYRGTKFEVGKAKPVVLNTSKLLPRQVLFQPKVDVFWGYINSLYNLIDRFNSTHDRAKIKFGVIGRKKTIPIYGLELKELQ